MTANSSESLENDPDPKMLESLARMLRHEVGDFLQKVYASVAILQARLPADWDQERQVLARLRARAEGCRDLVDAVQDFLSPLSLGCEPVDLSKVTQTLLTAARQRHPQLEITTEAAGATLLVADPRRTAQVGQMLLLNACEAARQRVVVQTNGDSAAGVVQWVFSDDGPGVSAEVADRLFRPFFSTRPSHAGLGLALARKIVLLHGGRIEAANLPERGFQVRVNWTKPRPAP